MTSYRLFEVNGTVTSGPQTADSYSSPFVAAVMFGVTSVSWLEGYWWWVCPAGGQPTAPQEFCIWQVYGAGQGALIEGSVVTSPALQSGWNWVALQTPIPLSIANDPTRAAGDGAAVYIASTAFSGPFPITSGQFGTGGAYAGGIIHGPLCGYSDGTGTLRAPAIGGGLSQGQFAAATATGWAGGTDPTYALPANNSSGSSNFWIDVQVSDTAPAGYSGSYRLWPNMPSLFHQDSADNDTFEQTMGTQFALSEPCTLNAVWFYSPTWAALLPAGLPASTQVWDATTGKIVAQTTTANWSGAVGSGWVNDSYASQQVTLPAGNYITSVYYPGMGNGDSPGQGFYAENKGYFGSQYQGTYGPGYQGISNGPLSSPALASAYNYPSLGNSCYIVNPAGTSGPLFPTNWDDKANPPGDDGETRWIDVEVTPAGSATPPPPAPSSGIPLTFFP